MDQTKRVSVRAFQAKSLNALNQATLFSVQRTRLTAVYWFSSEASTARPR